jgi:hypothetical protein
MAKIPLTIDPSYCSKWGYLEGIRELLQNAKDGDEHDGYPMEIEHFPRTNRLVITNKGAVIEPSTLLLLGKTSKKDGVQRGKFGEGFVLGTLALVRYGMQVTIRNGDEVWRPEITQPDPGHPFEGNDLLVFNTRKLQSGSDFSVTIEPISKEVWEETRKLFLFLTPPRTAETAIVNGSTILFGEEHKGRLFCRGIFVCTVADLECGYDLPALKVDRDRNAVDQWDLRWTLADLWRRALEASPEKNVPHVYRMVKEDKTEVKSLTYHVDAKLIQALRNEFEQEHGAGAVPVTSMSDSRELEAMGVKTAVVNNTLRELLDKDGSAVAAAKAKQKGKVVAEYTWTSLSTEEQATCTRWVERVTSEYSIVDFADGGAVCLPVNEGKTLAIGKSALALPPRDLLRLVVKQKATLSKVTEEDLWLDLLGVPSGNEVSSSHTPEDAQAAFMLSL